MRFFSGFCLKNEKKLFEDILDNSEFSVAGFSYGAIKAAEYVYKELNEGKRVDRVLLVSPAFFQSFDEKFKRVQLISFSKNPESYIENFLKNCSYPSSVSLEKYRSSCNKEDLKELLYYCWDRKKLDSIVKRGVNIEVFLGEIDKITDVKSAYLFFKEYATVYFFKKAGHILK
ncbi:pimelyl-ACP methyl ester esterase BioV [Nitrosophilus alvini]|uniref:pimelyl-ACP methyl ester esterase BioV n=1 Tax=Nitrosophilus alvini TaxID=2714855 RepID=UPI00190E1D25|nr:pimelyl-ACP methyl ester esterase BioV [Nitrosophilus alvini]